MFTGIIEAPGRIERATSVRGNHTFEISCTFETRSGESIAVDGVCLTVTDPRQGAFVADAVAETISLTTLKDKRQGDSVNLERAMLVTDRLGGHIVAGHVDEIGKVLRVQTLPGSWVFEFGVSQVNHRYVVSKGSIAIDGISLTVAKVHGTRVEVSVIPFTVEHTTLKNRRPGDSVNVEFDIIGKYVARMLGK